MRNKNLMLFKHLILPQVKEVKANHQAGIKQVLLAMNEAKSPITQVAYGKFEAGESSGMHQHPTMDESFFFLEGTGVCRIEKEVITIQPHSFVYIPAGCKHEISAAELDGNRLEFFYFGVATDET